MKRTLIIVCFAILIVACKSKESEYEAYKCETISAMLYPSIPEFPKIWIFFNRSTNKYFKVIKYERYWELSRSNYAASLNPKINLGYHLADGEGFGGYDWDDTFKTLDDAKEAATTRGETFLFKSGNAFEYHDGALYDNSTNKKLKKID